MLKLKNISKFALVVILTAVALGSPLKLKAQDDMPSTDTDEGSIVPATNSAPPVIIDDSDAGAVEGGEEYDG